MAIQVSGTEVISNARALNNIASVDATTAASISAAGVGGGGVDIQIFTSSGTWTKPADAKQVFVEVYGAGGGGSSGPNYDDNGWFPGCGGAGGAGFSKTFSAGDLTATVTVTIGAGGAGGAAQTTTAFKNAGATGGSTTFGSYLRVGGGSGGSGGNGSAGGTGGTVGATDFDGGTSYALDFQGNSSETPRRSSLYGGGYGGKVLANSGYSGGDILVGGLGGAGGGGGCAFRFGLGYPAGKGGLKNVTIFLSDSDGDGVYSQGTVGAAGVNFGDGGGGGGWGATANAGAGGAGNISGGGGGGGSSVSGYTSGAGGAGGNGYARVITIY